MLLLAALGALTVSAGAVSTYEELAAADGYAEVDADEIFFNGSIAVGADSSLVVTSSAAVGRATLNGGGGVLFSVTGRLNVSKVTLTGAWSQGIEVFGGGLLVLSDVRRSPTPPDPHPHSPTALRTLCLSGVVLFWGGGTPRTSNTPHFFVTHAPLQARATPSREVVGRRCPTA